MGRKSLGKQKRSVPLGPLRPSCREEKEFVKAFSRMLNHAVATVAANPQVRYPSGSVAERIRTLYSKFQPERHASAQKRAAALLSGSIEQRQRHFGNFHDRGADFWQKAPHGM